MKRTAILMAVLLIVPLIGFGNDQTARPRTDPGIENQRLPGEGAGAGKTANLSPVAEGTVKTIKISDDRAGNKRTPGVAENRNGDRLVIYRGPNLMMWYSFARRDGAWSAPKVIPNQPQLKDYFLTEVSADSTGRFHCVWEEPDVDNVYASFLDGEWTRSVKLDLAGKYDMGSSIGIRSNDQLIIANGQIVRSPSLTKDVFFYIKNKGESEFSRTNITHDKQGSCQPSIAVDADDHIWMTIKGEIIKGSTETLDIFLSHYNRNNEYVEYKLLSNADGWCFWPQTAINSEGKVMGAWAKSQGGNYYSRIYDPVKKTLGALKSVDIGLPLRPWALFWCKLAAHGKDFYLAAMNSARVVYLMKYDDEAGAWKTVTQVSSGPSDYFDIYAGNDQILIAWDKFADPSDVYLTTVAVTPLGPPPCRIAGTVTKDGAGEPGVTMTGLPTETVTDSSGKYSASVPNSWSGTVTPVKTDTAFSPESRTYTELTEDRLDQDYDAFPPVFSAVNVRAEKRIERSFFHGYTLYALTWEANPENAAHNVVISAQRVYRKARTEDDSKWVRITELPGTALKYEDLNVRSDSDYVYAVTCVNDKGFESPIY